MMGLPFIAMIVGRKEVASPSGYRVIGSPGHRNGKTLIHHGGTETRRRSFWKKRRNQQQILLPLCGIGMTRQQTNQEHRERPESTDKER
jgi:hypothetical protein